MQVGSGSVVEIKHSAQVPLSRSHPSVVRLPCRVTIMRTTSPKGVPCVSTLLCSEHYSAPTHTACWPSASTAGIGTMEGSRHLHRGGLSDVCDPQLAGAVLAAAVAGAVQAAECVSV